MNNNHKAELSTNLARPVAQALHLAVGMHFHCDGRDARLDRIQDSGVVELTDLRTLSPLQVRDTETGTLVAPTIQWMREAYKQGILHLTGSTPESAAERQSRFALLDPEACAFHDKKSLWRFRLAWRALEDEVVKTDREVGVWLDENYGAKEGDKEFPKPSPSSLRRWMRALEKGEKRTSTLVSQVGRRSGQSQLEPFVDSLVHEAALWFWTRKRAKIVQAYARLDAAIKAANDALPDATGRTKPYSMPSKETLRKRINRTRCYDTVLAKEGPTAAAKLYEGSGEPILVDRILQLALMDATMLEQAIVFDDDWDLPACKVRITALMDAASRVILGWHVYAGPNRAETSAEAILSCMMPNDYPAEMLAAYPGLADLFGRPAGILPDNELALVGPSSLPGINDAGITVHMPPVEMPQAKACLERFFRSLKEALAVLPGTIIDPKHAKDLDYDGVEAAALTLPQLRVAVAQVVASHNVSASKGLDGWSPLQVWTRRAGSRVTPPFENIDDLRRLLGRTYKALLTTDGVEFDGIRYRDSKAVKLLLNHMSHTSARRSQRRDGSATVDVRIRRADGNIDTIDVYDTVTNSYVTLPSTQPDYTHKLSAWEHAEFRKMAKKRGEPFEAEQARLFSKAKTIQMMDELAPKVAFQQRRQMAALYQSTQVDALLGGSQPKPCSEGVVTPQVTGAAFRRDDGLAPESQAKPHRTKKPPHQAPERPAGYGGTIVDFAPNDFDWDGVDADDNDPETGRQPRVSAFDDEGNNDGGAAE